MKEIEVALAIEVEIRNLLEREKHNLKEPGMGDLLSILILHQLQIEALLKLVEPKSLCFPNVDIEKMLGDSNAWNDIGESYKTLSKRVASDFTFLCVAYSLYEKMANYYTQAAAHSPYSSGKVFFSSLSQTKHGLRRKIDSLSRINYNRIWEQVGFAPYILG